jgi:hypothetical protein
LAEVTAFVELARDGAYMTGDRRVHHTERSRWRHTFRRLVANALAALTADDPAPARYSGMTVSRRSPAAGRSSSSAGRQTTAGPAGATVRWQKRRRRWPFRSPGCLPRRTCGARSPGPTGTPWRWRTRGPQATAHRVWNLR